MSFRDESDDGNLRKPFLHTGSWYRMGSRQSSMMGSSQVIRDSSISVVACVLIVALGPIQFGFTVCNFLYIILCLRSSKICYFWMPKITKRRRTESFLLIYLFIYFCSLAIHHQRNLQSPRILD